jgi:hypothetical protein
LYWWNLQPKPLPYLRSPQCKDADLTFHGLHDCTGDDDAVAVEAAAAGDAPCVVSAAGGAGVIKGSSRRYGFIDASPASSGLQGISACVAVVLSTFSAAFLTYNTPVVGLGCRSGNYIIYGLLALSCFALELASGALDDRFRCCEKGRQPRKNANYNSSGHGIRRAKLLRRFHVAITVLEVASCMQLLSVLIGQPIGLYNSGVGGYITFGCCYGHHPSCYGHHPFYYGHHPACTCTYVLQQINYRPLLYTSTPW